MVTSVRRLARKKTAISLAMVAAGMGIGALLGSRSGIRGGKNHRDGDHHQTGFLRDDVDSGVR